MAGEQRFEGLVRNVSVHGACLLLSPAMMAPADDQPWSTGTSVHELTLAYHDKELYRGPAEVRHSELSEDGVLLGVALHGPALDLHQLHRLSFRLAFRLRWKNLLKSLDEIPGGSFAGAEDDFTTWVERSRRYLESVRSFLEEEEQRNSQEDLMTRQQCLDDMLDEGRADLGAWLLAGC